MTPTARAGGSSRRPWRTSRPGWRWPLLVAAGAGVLVLAVLGFGFAIGAVLAIVLLVFYIQKGTAGPNTYGPDPLGQGA